MIDVSINQKVQPETIWAHEESAQKALLLKRKELKWKLMEASQIQNQAKLDEIKEEVDYHKKKMIKIAALASKLRAKFIRVAKVAKTAEAHYKKVEDQLLKQEKYVADEKMQITKLAVDCQNTGTQLYGPDYRLTINSRIARDKERQRFALKLKATKSDLNGRMIELRRKVRIKSLPKKTKTETQVPKPILVPKEPLTTRLSSLYDLKYSPLRRLASYRLMPQFPETGAFLTDLNYAHNICPNCYICLPDLIGSCTDKSCLYQHKSNYLMTDIDKLTDILSYKPSLTGYKADVNLSQEENDYQCRLKLKQYAAKLLAKNSDKPVEILAQNLVKFVRANLSDHDLLLTVRKLPKTSHLVCNIPGESNNIQLDEEKASPTEEATSPKSEETCSGVKEESSPSNQKTRVRFFDTDDASLIEPQDTATTELADVAKMNQNLIKFC